ncbi:MAG TPA: heavy metal translocating P-type ATPase [Candidatus Syntrophosphaera sp.]|nr:heavy metal translocating P-type ATPase [Candidatus Syntrophosphaera sp.]
MKKQLNIGIDGMHCAACSARAEKALSQMKGVYSANVNLALEEASLEYDDKLLNQNDFEKTIAALGFALREEATLGEDEQIKNMLAAGKRMWLMWALALIVMALMLPLMLLKPPPAWHHEGVWAIFGLTVLALVFPARGVYVSAFKSVRSGSANMDVLIALGTLASLLVTPLSLVVKGINPHDFSGIAAMILAFHLTGRYLETRARGKASEAIRKLLNLGAKTAILLVDGKETEVPIHKVKVGDIFVVRPGAKVPVDGVILAGSANLDESMATGESMPVLRKTGDRIIGATVNRDGFLQARAEKVGKDSFLAQVVKMVQEAQHSKVPIQLLADRVTAVFVPVVLSLALATFLAWLVFPAAMGAVGNWLRGFIPLSTANTGFAAALMAAVATLVIACPCALGLATPTALMVGSGMGAERGILIHNGEALQRMKDIKAIVFDKTGTLTHGKPELLKAVGSGIPENEALTLALSLEAASEHPLARAIVAAANGQGLQPLPIKDFANHSGRGISALVNDRKMWLGSRSLLEEQGIADFSGLEDDPVLKHATKVFLGVDGKAAGAFYLADTVRPEAAEVVKTLKQMGIESIMLSGDNEETASAIAAQCGITQIRARALPADKANIIKELQAQYGSVAMVGDGINDAPALKQADIGIAMGQGTDIAIEASDITILRDELALIPQAVKLSLQTFRKIRQNLFWAFFYNLIAIPLAVFGALHPVIAEIAMATSSVTVVSNANLLRRIRL